MSRLVIGAVLLALGNFAVAMESAAEVTPQVAVVRSLYERFAAEAVLDQPSASGELVDQPMSVLSLYFDKPLATLWMQDRECVKRTHEICRLDFLPLWDSQDPSGATVSIQPDTGKNSVQAVIVYGGTEKRVVHYRLVHTPAGWRIHDIEFEANRTSLRHILDGTVD